MPALTVAENIFLGNEPRRGPFIDWHELWTRARTLLRRFAVDIDPTATVRRTRRRAASCSWKIVKALSKESRILILDEPTGPPSRKARSTPCWRS